MLLDNVSKKVLFFALVSIWCGISCEYFITTTSHEHHVVSNHRGPSIICLPAYADSHQRNSKPALHALWEGNSPMTSEFPAQRASNAEKASIWWRHHVTLLMRRLDDSGNKINMMTVHALAPRVVKSSAATVVTMKLNTLRPGQNGRHFPDDMFKCIFLNENVWISIDISLKFVPKGSINNNPTLFQIMAWRRPGDKPLSEPMMVSSLTQLCVTRPQWVQWGTNQWRHMGIMAS